MLTTYQLRLSKEEGRTPEGSSHPSRESFGKSKEELLAEIKGAPKHHLEAKNQVSRRGSPLLGLLLMSFKLTSETVFAAYSRGNTI
jgi:hypothetical protein